MRSVHLVPMLFVIAGAPCLADAPQTRPTGDAAKTVIDLEHAPDRVRSPQGLGTAGYRAAQRERPFLEKTPPNARSDGSILDNKTPYDLSAQAGKRVAWFGIVRGVTRLPDGRYELLLEHKYFDGLTDLHILALSFNGAGDFKAIVNATADEFPVKPLMLVRVYGVVTAAAAPATRPDKADPANQAADPAPPTIAAEYVRAFPWKTFTFIGAYGKDQTNPRWRKLCKVNLDDIYDAHPDEDYYRRRLGEPQE